MTNTQNTPISWLLPLAEIGKEGYKGSLCLTPAQMSDLAGTLGLSKLEQFKATVEITPKPRGQFDLEGRIAAVFEQPSAISLEPLMQSMEEPFSIKFLPDHLAEKLEETELDIDFEEETIEFYDGQILELGQLIYEYFCISLDAFPRKEGEVFEWAEQAGEPENNPFAVLKSLSGTKNEPGK